MDDVIAKALQQPLGTPAADDVWERCAPLLRAALLGDGCGSLLEALEELARNAALTGSSDVGSLFDAVAEGCFVVQSALAAHAGPDAQRAVGRLSALEHDAAARIAAGYAAGLEETIGRLRRQAEEYSPLDPASGAMRASETLGRLGLEVDRCRRMALSLGVLGMALGETGTAPRAECGSDVLHVVATALSGNVRRYDGVGRTADGDFLVVLPDVSRRALAAIAERLRHEVGDELGQAAPCVIALAHYDYVDVSADEMMTAVERRVGAARAAGESLCWV